MHPPWYGKGISGPPQHPYDHEGAPCTDPLVAPGLERHGQVEGSTPASLADACVHHGEPDGWRAPEEARAIGWEEDVDLDGDPPAVVVLRADRAGGDTKTRRSRRALKLAQMAVAALGEWQVDQAAEREAAGSH